LNDLAWLLATCEPSAGGDPARAVRLAERAQALSGGKSPACLDTLAAAYAAEGRFADAVRTAQQALELAESAGQTPLATKIQTRLEGYRVARPCRQNDSSEP
jgi:spermidine synthase